MDQYSLLDSDLSIRLRGAWEQVQRRLQAEVKPAYFERFIRPLEPVQFEDGVIRLGAPGKFVYEWVKERYHDTLRDLFTDEMGEDVIVDLVQRPHERQAIEAINQVAVSLDERRPSKFKPNDRFTFESFVVGQSNRLAFAGAKAVSEKPGQKYNPLFIYGPSGLGKTHLLHSIAREILAEDPNFPLVYMSAQHFAEQFINAVQTNKVEQFRRAQRNVGLWLLDDIQFIAGKDKTQEEIFHTFNNLHSFNKQIVITSDRPPRDLFLMEERLRSRFEAGLVADIQQPDTETRCAIILSKAELEAIPISHEVAMVLAEGVPGNIRILEGALTKLSVTASIANEEITTDMAHSFVEQYYRSRQHSKPSFGQIVEAVGKTYGIPIDEIKGASRKAPIVHARHVAVFITREITGDSWKHIGTLFGDRDHTSMMHGHQKISEMMVRDRELRSIVKHLIRSLHPDA